jgi:hypothetical protein
MFPHTAHVEVVSQLELKKINKFLKDEGVL